MTSRTAPEWITARHKRYRRDAWLWKWLFNPRLIVLPIGFAGWGGPIPKLLILGFELRYVLAALFVLCGVAEYLLRPSERARNFSEAADCVDIAIARYEASSGVADTTLVEAAMQAAALLQRRSPFWKSFFQATPG